MADLVIPKTGADAARAYATVRGHVLFALYSLGESAEYGWEETGFRLRSLEQESGYPREVVRAVMRDLVDDGLARYLRGLMDEDGMAAGSGYALTRKGHDLAWNLTAEEVPA